MNKWIHLANFSSIWAKTKTLKWKQAAEDSSSSVRWTRPAVKTNTWTHLNTPAHTQAAAGQVLGRRRISETFSCRLPAGADEDEGAAVTFRRFIWWPRYVFLRLSDQHRREENTVDVNIVLIYRHCVAPQNRRHFKLLLRILKRRPAGRPTGCVLWCSVYFFMSTNPPTSDVDSTHTMTDNHRTLTGRHQTRYQERAVLLRFVGSQKHTATPRLPDSSASFNWTPSGTFLRRFSKRRSVRENNRHLRKGEEETKQVNQTTRSLNTGPMFSQTEPDDTTPKFYRTEASYSVDGLNECVTFASHWLVAAPSISSFTVLLTVKRCIIN